VYEIADTCEAALIIIWTTSPPRVVQERMLRRREALDEEDASDADWDVYLELRRRADPIRRPHVVLNTSTDTSTIVRRLIERALASGPAAAG
jgi:predicted kinase